MSVHRARPARGSPALLLAVFWLGLLAGVSFLATPVKFAAPGLSLPVALEVGRVTFGLFSKVEWGLAALLCAAVLTGRLGAGATLPALLAAGIVALQALWLLPVLDARVGEIAAGAAPSASRHHGIYVALEAAKALLLILAALAALRPREAR
ncbi:hypothetical protein [Neomegalonema sp.]|uniref:hypothetical protein n=1 Tax=Neomegalonema sp. TaxID=2039713 RepID=UPI00260C689A|nr:hypothetical protein [Neomegalonema sp.]MDD2868322.1 hypothetical protein [Neomegalonema sp.]